MADQTNRGVSKVIARYVHTCKPGAQVTNDDTLLRIVKKEIPGATYDSLRSALSYLHQKGILDNSAISGLYVVPHADDRQADPDTIVIDNLLDAMAKAEPILRRWKRVQEALNGTV